MLFPVEASGDEYQHGVAFVVSLGDPVVRILIVCRLSQLINILCGNLKLIALKKFFHQMTSLPTCESANNSASVLEVVTVLCFNAFHAIGPPKRENRYPWQDFRVVLSSANDASDDM